MAFKWLQHCSDPSPPKSSGLAEVGWYRVGRGECPHLFVETVWLLQSPARLLSKSRSLEGVLMLMAALGAAGHTLLPTVGPVLLVCCQLGRPMAAALHLPRHSCKSSCLVPGSELKAGSSFSSELLCSLMFSAQTAHVGARQRGRLQHTCSSLPAVSLYTVAPVFLWESALPSTSSKTSD